MDYAEILAQTKQLLGEVSEGSSTYAATDFSAAIQWAQEQACQHLGLTYTEVVQAVSTGAGPWADPIHWASISSDAIKVTRVELSDGPVPTFSIAISPVSQEITLDGTTHAVLTGAITRFGGFDEDIFLNIPGSFADDIHFDGQFQDIDRTTSFATLQAQGHNTIAPVADSFTVELWSDTTGWAAYSSYWTDFHFFGVSSETSLTIPSNDATVVLSTVPYFEIVVTPSTSTVQFIAGDQVNPPLVLTVDIIRHNGFSEQVDILFPLMQGSWDGWVAIVNGVTLPVEAEYDNYLLVDAPDTFTCEFDGTSSGWSLVNWISPDGVQLIGSSLSFTNVPSNVVIVDTENI